MKIENFTSALLTCTKALQGMSNEEDEFRKVPLVL
jgi:hypothetical protein